MLLAASFIVKKSLSKLCRRQRAKPTILSFATGVLVLAFIICFFMAGSANAISLTPATNSQLLSINNQNFRKFKSFHPMPGLIQE